MRTDKTAEAKDKLAGEQRVRFLSATFRRIHLVVFLIFIFAVIQMFTLWQVCKTGMKTSVSLQRQGLPALKDLAALQENLAIYRLASYEYLFVQEGERAGKARAAEGIAVQMHAELKNIQSLFPESDGRQLAFNLEKSVDDLDGQFLKVRKLVDSDFPAAMKSMDQDIPPRTQRVDADADALEEFGYQFSGGQASATFASFGWIKRTAVQFGLANSLVVLCAFVFVLGAARRSRAQLSETLARLDERSQELAGSQALYQSLVDQMHAGIFRKDMEGRFVFVNSWYCKLKGYQPDQFLGKTPSEVAASETAVTGTNHPVLMSEAEIANQGENDHVEIMQTRRTVEREEQYSAADGKVHYLRVIKSPVFGPDGKIAGTQGMLFDITDRKQAEAELAYERDLLRKLLDNSPDAIYFKDAQSRFIKSSKVQATSFGLKAADEMTGRTDFDFFMDEHARPAFEDEQEIIRTGRPLIGKVEKETLKDGRVTWVLTNKIPLRDKDGQIIGTFGISKDITEIKKAELQLEELNRQLIETSRQAGMAEVASNVLHNVGNVLNSVNVSATLVSDGVKKSKATSLAKVVVLLNEHANDLGNFMTSDPRGKQLPAYLSKLSEHFIEHQNVTVKELDSLRTNIDHIKEIVAMQQSYAQVSGVKEIVNLTELVEDSIRMSEGALSRHGVEVVREFENVPPINVEKHKIVQILVNLIRNAKHACQDSERPDKRLTVRVTSKDGRIKISVNDNGVGIPAENLTRIFNHGFTTRKDGHGFGLHSGALAAKDMGGSLTARSEGVGKGAMFTLELPCTTNTAGEMDAVLSPRRASAEIPPGGVA